MKEIYKSYYTDSDTITSYMINSLKIEDKHRVLEPSAGEGVFIDKILDSYPNVYIDAYDVDDYAISVLRKKYENKNNISIIQSDTLLDVDLDFKVSTYDGYDRIIGNPPYGLKFNTKTKKDIDRKYSEIYTKDSYVLFLYRCLTLLNENGRLVFIIPDTFLYLNLHKNFREFLYNNFCVKEIAIFPSNLFPGVRFGYSKLCIITIDNTPDCINQNVIKIYDEINTDSDLSLMIDNKDHLSVTEITQQSILKKPTLNLQLNQKLDQITKNCELYLGDIADCVTGIYTGNNTKYMKVISKEVRNSKNYETISSDEIDWTCENIEGISNGVQSNYIPIIKGSVKVPYIQPKDEWFIRWDESSIYHYNHDKKARFQNSSYYFREGIAIPMLKSKKIRAAIMKNRVFDQSIVGIFPKQKSDLYLILALLNSEIVNDIIHNINPTVNNSANYMKRIPIPTISNQDRIEIDKLVEEHLSGLKDNTKDINFYIEKLYLES